MLITVRRLFALLVLLALPAGARAQTLTIDVEASGVEASRVEARRVEARAEIEARVTVPERTSEAPAGATGEVPVVVVVPPLEDAPAPVTVTAPAPRPVTIAAPVPARAPAPVTVAAPAPAPEEDEEDLQAAFLLSTFAEWIDLSTVDLGFDDPEISFLDGVQLSPGFAGQDTLGGHASVGVAIGVGLRAAHIMRGPELRLVIGGSEFDASAYSPIPGADARASASVRSAFTVRLESAVGVQAEIGDFVPYAMVRAAVGGAYVDVAVRDAELGELGTETLEGTILQLGAEAGFEARLGGCVRLGALVRGSFLGTPSLGGALTMTVVSDDE